MSSDIRRAWTAEEIGLAFCDDGSCSSEDYEQMKQLAEFLAQATRLWAARQVLIDLLGSANWKQFPYMVQRAVRNIRDAMRPAEKP